jgi:hypothetical protein
VYDLDGETYWYIDQDTGESVELARETDGEYVTLKFPLELDPIEMHNFYLHIRELEQVTGAVVTTQWDYVNAITSTDGSLKFITLPREDEKIIPTAILYSKTRDVAYINNCLSTLPRTNYRRLSGGRREYPLLKEMIIMGGGSIFYEERCHMWYILPHDIHITDGLEFLNGHHWLATDDFRAMYAFVQAYRGGFCLGYCASYSAVDNQQIFITYPVDSSWHQRFFMHQVYQRYHQSPVIHGAKTESLVIARKFYLTVPGAAVFLFGDEYVLLTPYQNINVEQINCIPDQIMIDALGITDSFDIITQSCVSELDPVEMATGINLNGRFYRSADLANLTKDPLDRKWISEQIRVTAQTAPFNHLGTDVVPLTPIPNDTELNYKLITSDDDHTDVIINGGPSVCFEDFWLENGVITQLYKRGLFLPRVSNLYAKFHQKSLNTQPSFNIECIRELDETTARAELQWLLATSDAHTDTSEVA